MRKATPWAFGAASSLAMLVVTSCGGGSLNGGSSSDIPGDNAGLGSDIDVGDPNQQLTESPGDLDLGDPQMLATGRDPSVQSDDVSQISCAANLASGRSIRCDDRQRIRYFSEPKTGAWVQNYSAAGYRGGGVQLPELATRTTVKPSGGDDTNALQAALDAASQQDVDSNGWRGKVLLAPGTFNVSRTLTITAGGVVLEGSGSVGSQATTLKLVGAATTLLRVTGSGGPAVTGTTYAVQGLPVPAGTAGLQLSTSSGLSVGDTVQINSPRNLSWLTMMWGGTYPPVRDGKTQAAWGSAMSVRMTRTITKVAGNTIILDTPLGDTLPADNFTGEEGVTVRQESSGKMLAEFGMGHIRLQGRFVAGTLGDKQLVGVNVNNAQNSWFDDIDAKDFGFATIVLGGNTRNITVQDVRMARSGVQDGGAKPFDLNIYGQKILVQGCASRGDKTFYATHNNASSVGPNVVQNYRVQGKGTFEPHQRWSPGILYDNVYIPAGGIALKDRAGAGSGHGWGTGFSVVYNSLAGTQSTDKAGMDAMPGFTLDQPPQSINLGMGLVGPNRSLVKNSNLFDSADKPIGPPSLWAHQLWQRLGPDALRTVVGPWHVLTADGSACLAAQDLKEGAKLVVTDCDAAGQRALFDLTSHGWLRLGDSGLCVDAEGGKPGARAALRSCNDSALQRWAPNSRGGFATAVRLSGGTTCLTQAGDAVQLGPCTTVGGPWRLLVTHLAR